MIISQLRPTRQVFTIDNPMWGFAGIYGGNTTGGVSPYLVTTLADSLTPSAGMLRDGLTQSNRHITFADGLNGNIELAGEITIPSNTTIDGVWSSIRLVNYRTIVSGTNMILRNLCFYHGGQTSQAVSDDSLSILANRVLIDRCAIGFGVDECLDIIGSGVTVQRSVIGWGVCRAHPNFVSSGVEHGLAARLDGRPSSGFGGVAAIANLFALCNWRPSCLGDVVVDGNMFYGYGNSPGGGPGYSYPIQVYQSTVEGVTRIDMRKNRFLPGPATDTERTVKINDTNGTTVVWTDQENTWTPLGGSPRAIVPVVDPSMPAASVVPNFNSIRNDAPAYDSFSVATDAGPLNPDNFVTLIRQHVANKTGALVQVNPAEVIPGGFAGL